jgi:hypothetical protein
MPRKEVKAPAGLAELALLLKTDVRDLYDARNTMMRDMRDRREQENPVSIPVGYKGIAKEVRLSLLSDTVDLMAAIINDAKWHVHVDPFDEKPTARRNSSTRERWSEAVILQMVAELGRPVLDNIAVNQVGDGMGVAKLVYRPDHWSELPTTKDLFGKKADELNETESDQYVKAVDRSKKGAKLPFSLVDVDPLTAFPIYGPDGELQAVMEICERPTRAVLLQYHDKLGLNKKGEIESLTATAGEARPLSQYETNRDSAKAVEFCEYWDREWHITFVDDVIVKVSHHNYGRPPYFFCYAKPNPSRKPEVATRPIGYKSKWLCDLLDSLWTMMGNVGTMFSFPTPVTKTPLNTNVPKGRDGKPRHMQWKAGQHIVLYEGQEFEFATPPVEHLQMMDKLVARAHEMYDATTGLGPAIKGMGSSDQAGYALNQLMQASMLSLAPAVKSRDVMLAEIVRFIWRLVEKRIKDTVYVWGTEADPEEGVKGKEKTWLSLGPKDIAGYYKVEVESKPLVDQMRIARGQFALTMVKGRLLDRRRAIEDFLGYEDPDSILDDIWVDEVIETPGPIKDMTINNALKRAGYLRMDNGMGAQPQPGPEMPPGAVPPPGVVPPPPGTMTAPPGAPPQQPGMPGGLPQVPVAPGIGMGAPSPVGAPPPGAGGPTGGALNTPGVGQVPPAPVPQSILPPQ